MKFENFDHTEVRICDDKFCLGNAFVMFPPLACSKQLLLFLKKKQYLGSPRGLGEQGNIEKISKGTRKHESIFREQGNKTLQIRGRKHCNQILEKGNK